MTTIAKENWYYVIGDKKPSIECPQCGANLLGDRAIQGIRLSGEVYNSVVCPCGFHDHVILAGYNGPHIERG
jgi:C4-type Zn-finger protein